jgi:hypothetical protein
MSFMVSGGYGGINDDGGIGMETADQASAEQLAAAQKGGYWMNVGGGAIPLFGNQSGSGSGTTQENQQQQTSAAPDNSRTDVVLYGREVPPEPQHTGWFWETDWYSGTCSDVCSQSPANKNQTITGSESINGGPWNPTGDPMKGEATDMISPDAKSFNQKWFVDGKQVKLVVGPPVNGNWITTWEVHVVIDKVGDKPIYSPVP